MNKKGFTLIELLSTIVIISLVVLLAIPIYNNVTGKTKERAYESKIKLVEVAAANYAESFKNEIKVNPVPICVSINTLIKNNLLTSDGNNEIYLSNPYTDGVEKTENLLGQVELTYENNEVVAKYSINGTCVVSIGTPDVDDKYVVDVEPPQGTFFINEGDYTNQTTIHLTLNPSDADAKYFCYKDNNVGPCVVYTELSTVNKNNVAYNLVNNTEGIHHVYVWYKDKYNNVGSAMHDQITYDRTLPTGGVQINGGTAYTPTRNVTLNLNYADNLSGVESMCISDTTTCPGANWVIPSASLGWTIPSGEGNHTVSVWYRDRSGNISTRYQATIMLDTVRPTNGTVVINGNATYTASPNVTLTISSSDATSGVLQMCVSQSPTCTGWVGYVTTYNITLTGPQGTNTVYVKYRDRAGNESATQISDTIILDTVNPTCTYTGESTTWTNANRTITTGCIDPTSGCDPVYSGGVTTFTTTTQTGALTSYTIKDNAGNQVVCTKTANVYVDKTNPTCSYGGESTTWTSADRTITTGCVDTNSLCNASYSGGLNQFTTTTKTASLNPYTIRDNAGNQVVCTKTADIYVDKTEPTCTNSGDSTAWTNSNRTISYGCNDNGQSGCNASYSGGSATYSTTTLTASIAAYEIRDMVGNTRSCPLRTANVYVDKTAPTCTNSGDSTTWTNGDRTIYKGCSDTNSLCNASYSGGSTPFTTTTKTATIAAYEIRDMAGNTTSCGARTANVYVDKTAPTCTSGGDSTTWTNGDRTITNGCSDADSLCNASYSGGSTPFTTTTKTATIAAYEIRDMAGNTTSCGARTANVYVDKTAPTCTNSGGSSGYTVGPITITGTCTDSHSGCVANASKTYSNDITSYSESPGTIKDNAGNQTTCSSDRTVLIKKYTYTETVTAGTSCTEYGGYGDATYVRCAGQTLYQATCDDGGSTSPGCQNCNGCTSSSCYSYVRERQSQVWSLTQADALQACIDWQAADGCANATNKCILRARFYATSYPTTWGYKISTFTRN